MNLPARRLRNWIYVSSPKDMAVVECPICHGQDFVWSTFCSHLWCNTCQADVQPEHWGILDGPVIMETCQGLGICFDAVDLLTRTITPFSHPSWPEPIFTAQVVPPSAPD